MQEAVDGAACAEVAVGRREKKLASCVARLVHGTRSKENVTFSASAAPLTHRATAFIMAASSSAGVTPWGDGEGFMEQSAKFQSEEARHQHKMELRNSLIEYVAPHAAHWLGVGIDSVFPGQGAKVAEGIKGATQLAKVAGGGPAALQKALQDKAKASLESGGTPLAQQRQQQPPEVERPQPIEDSPPHPDARPAVVPDAAVEPEETRYRNAVHLRTTPSVPLLGPVEEE